MSFRIAVKVQSNCMNRVLNNLTHPSCDQLGSSRMTFRKRKGMTISPELNLLLGVMNEEYETRMTMEGLVGEEHVERAVEKETRRVSSLASLFEDVADYIPPPPPKVVCEFTLGIGEKLNWKVPVTLAVFSQLTFRIEGNSRMTVDQGAYDGQEVGVDAETSGVWRVAAGHQRTTAPPNLQSRPGRIAG